DDDTLPVLKHHSALLENMHIEQVWLGKHQVALAVMLSLLSARHSASWKQYQCLLRIYWSVPIFGAYATHPFRFSDHYYGTGETFLYTFSPHFKVFKWSGENTYFINGDTSSLELGGGGGRFGLWLDADLYHGRSNSCSTFNNDILSKKEDFIIQDVEVWTFE
ncbi:NCOA7 protein, partial [Todus mexicanus]|nr:NCOA7 protein [Todus mexicanus]